MKVVSCTSQLDGSFNEAALLAFELELENAIRKEGTARGTSEGPLRVTYCQSSAGSHSDGFVTVLTAIVQ